MVKLAKRTIVIDYEQDTERIATPTAQLKVEMKFRKKPVVIEAFQMTKERRWDNSEWPVWLHVAWNKQTGLSKEGALFVDSDDPSRELLCIGTLEGVHRVSWDDWIIRGVKGELYPCKPDIFSATYEPW
jgi:hypothetical protein